MATASSVGLHPWKQKLSTSTVAPTACSGLSLTTTQALWQPSCSFRGSFPGKAAHFDTFVSVVSAGRLGSTVQQRQSQPGWSSVLKYKPSRPKTDRDKQRKAARNKRITEIMEVEVDRCLTDHAEET
eukprot:CAMPEP_0194479184 /NCGR_PEP_ID=MMETSP0253-20130528/2389_1 /TAXON_ID=2966 /ORGANISM="Noctiluca scintillans" /LENGTH=126 /DNA_ID=CAMNT_0039318363 /DNA_START=100 /DNA_END=480 /DNA_ORIENTATION=-